MCHSKSHLSAAMGGIVAAQSNILDLPFVAVLVVLGLIVEQLQVMPYKEVGCGWWRLISMLVCVWGAH